MAPPSPLRAVGVTDSCCSRPEAGSGERTDGQRAHAVPAPLPDSARWRRPEWLSAAPVRKCRASSCGTCSGDKPLARLRQRHLASSCAHSWLTRRNSRGGSGWPRVSIAQHLREGRTSKASPPERSKKLFRTPTPSPPPPPHTHTADPQPAPHLPFPSSAPLRNRLVLKQTHKTNFLFLHLIILLMCKSITV